MLAIITRPSMKLNTIPSKIICIGKYCMGSVDSMERETVEWNSGMVEWENSGMCNYD